MATRLQELVGQRVRLLRTAAGITQDQVATAAQRLGFSWGRSSVAQLEAGTRALSASELFALPAILGEALADIANLDHSALSLIALTLPAKGERVALSPLLQVDADDLIGMLLRGDLPDVQGGGATVTEAERKAARHFGVSVGEIQAAAHRCWGRPFNDERGRRVAEMHYPELFGESDQPPRHPQQLGGWATRTMYEELAAELGLEEK